MKHTPGPWEVSHKTASMMGSVNDEHYTIESLIVGRNGVIADTLNCDFLFTIEEQKANAEFIVRACNAHDDMLAACKDAATELGEFIADCIEDANEFDYRVVRILEAAIAKAEGTKLP